MVNERLRQEIIAKLVAARENLDCAIRLSLAATQADLIEIARATGMDEVLPEMPRRMPPHGVRSGGGDHEARGSIASHAIMIPRVARKELAVMIDENRRVGPVSARPLPIPVAPALPVAMPVQPEIPRIPIVLADPDGDSDQTFGNQLKRERERRGITLHEISISTKIRTEMLQAMEEEQFQHLPGGFFNRSFVRAYARHVGLDEKEMVDEYISKYERKAKPPVAQASQVPHAAEAARAVEQILTGPPPKEGPDVLEGLAYVKNIFKQQKALALIVVGLIADLLLLLLWMPQQTWEPSNSTSRWKTFIASQQALEMTAVVLAVILCTVLAWTVRQGRVAVTSLVGDVTGDVMSEDAPQAQSNSRLQETESGVGVSSVQSADITGS